MIRKYENKDYHTCIKIINDIWNFDNRFKPKELSELFKKIYILDSLSLSNFAVVIEEKGEVKGFLFGNCGNKSLIKNEFNGFGSKIRIVKELLLIKNVSFKKKLQYMIMPYIHEKNRKKIESKRENEVNLFAVDPDTQGKGYGKILITDFIDYCKKQNAKHITLETDKECNYKFYNHLGFEIKGEFCSPIQKAYTGKAGETFLFELKLI